MSLNYREKHYVFDILPLSVCISVETLLPVYDNYYSVFGYQLKHSFSCMIITTRCLDITVGSVVVDFFELSVF